MVCKAKTLGYGVHGPAQGIQDTKQTLRKPPEAVVWVVESNPELQVNNTVHNIVYE